MLQYSSPPPTGAVDPFYAALQGQIQLPLFDLEGFAEFRAPAEILDASRAIRRASGLRSRCSGRAFWRA
eukprot:6025538-Alexandrium_andersonii.AAC.1